METKTDNLVWRRLIWVPERIMHRAKELVRAEGGKGPWRLLLANRVFKVRIWHNDQLAIYIQK